MADDVTFQSGTPATPPATTVVATDEEGGKHYQWVKLVFGADATITKVSTANPLPVTLPTGASTAANQTTIIGHVDGIEALLTALAAGVTIAAALPAGNNNIGDVDVASSALPAGAATSANQSTGNGHLSTLAGTVAGTEVQVDVLTLPNVTLAAGTNTNEVVGDVAEDAALAGNPVRTGGRASQARPTAMSANGDIVSPWYDLAGAMHVVPGAATTATLSAVNDSNTSQSLLASNTSRKGVIIHNDSDQILKIKYGTTASASSYTYSIAVGAHWEMPGPIYTGAIDGIWASDSTGAARITELT